MSKDLSSPLFVTSPSRPATPITRRSFLTKAGLAAAGAALIPSANAVANIFSRERQLALRNVHTNEELTIVCRPDQFYDRRVIQQFNHFLRDHHSDEVRSMDPALIDLLYAVSAFTGSSGTFNILSGYRSQETNSWLRKFNHGVAEHSMHIEGKAVDIRITDIDTRTLHRVALALQQGGVGYYPRSDFVHLDTGTIRSW
jgi:uncharacterized protein YcbK (DUF882 family)